MGTTGDPSGPPLEPCWLFTYGTLGPRALGADFAGPWEADALRGRLFDLGPYPALIDLDDPSAEWVEGDARPVSTTELIESLDLYEGVADGHFRRERTQCRSGRVVWVYVFNRPLPPTARGPLVRWEGPGRAS